MQIILFDMDNTLVSADTVSLWIRFLHKKGVISDADWEKQRQFHADYIANRLDVLASFEFELSILKRVSLSHRAVLRHEFFEEMVKPCIPQTNLSLIEAYKAQPNTIVVLITATLTFLASPVAEYAKVDMLISTEAEMQGEEFTGKVLGIPNMGEGKLKKFQLWLEENQIIPTHTVLYSDSINDLPLLSYVKKPIVVDPDPQLHTVAIQRNWEIISLKKAAEALRTIDTL